MLLHGRVRVEVRVRRRDRVRRSGRGRVRGSAGCRCKQAETKSVVSGLSVATVPASDALGVTPSMQLSLQPCTEPIAAEASLATLLDTCCVTHASLCDCA